MTGRRPTQTPLFFAHGAGATPQDHPLPALRDSLGAGYRIIAPDLGPPDPEAWSKQLKPYLTGEAAQAILVGHSLGGSHILKCLAELGPAARPRVFLGLACPLWGLPGWEDEAFALPDWAPEALSHLPMRFIQARDDTIVDIAHLTAYGQRFPQARTHAIATGGHTFDTDLSALVVAISEL